MYYLGPLKNSRKNLQFYCRINHQLSKRIDNEILQGFYYSTIQLKRAFAVNNFEIREYLYTIIEGYLMKFKCIIGFDIFKIISKEVVGDQLY